MRFRTIFGTIAIGAPLLAMLSVSASAANPIFSFEGPGDSGTLYISSNGGVSFLDVYAGRYQGKLDSGSTFNIFCTDANHEITTGETYTADISHNITDPVSTTQDSYGGYDGGLGSAMISPTGDYGSVSTGSSIALTDTGVAFTRSQEVAYLADKYLNASSLSQADSTAISASIWDIVQDGGDGLATGTLQSNSAGIAAYGALVSSYESEALAAVNPAYRSSTATWIQAVNPNAQDYVYVPGGSTYQLTPTPEPSSMAAFAFTGAGLLGLMLFARRRCAKAGALA